VTAPDRLAVARACIGAAQGADDPEACAYFLANGELALRTLETELRETRDGLRAVRSEAVRKWKLTQLEAKP